VKADGKLGLFFGPEDGGNTFLTLNGLHGVISLKIELFITTAVTTCKYLLDENRRSLSLIQCTTHIDLHTSSHNLIAFEEYYLIGCEAV
jgi:hypothetical protein